MQSPLSFVLSSAFVMAEVLDKLEFPWQFHHYVPMLGVLVSAGGLAASKRSSLRIVGLLSALLWIPISLLTDPWFTSDIGPALRAELSDVQRERWLRTILEQALVPIAVTLPVFLWRTWQSGRRG
jgi:hypothetical protein